MSIRRLDHEELLESLGFYSNSKNIAFDSNKNPLVIEPILNESQYSYQNKDDSSHLINKSGPKKLFSMIIDLPNTNSDMIIVLENDDLTQVARTFCKKHGLGEKFQAIILETLMANCQNLNKDSFSYKKVGASNTNTLTHARALSTNIHTQNNHSIKKSETTPEKHFFTLGDRKEETPPTPYGNSDAFGDSPYQQQCKFIYIN